MIAPASLLFCAAVLGASAQPLLFKPHYHRAGHSFGSVMCPDGKSMCPDGNTCCKLTSGSYGCCPLPKAVCCSDHLHCCPEGTTCDVAQGKCNRGKLSISWFEKQPSTPVTVKDVMCPPDGQLNGQLSCPYGSTCCKLTSGQYGCCPLPKAVCCSDHLHCCPSGTTCDIAQGKCNRGKISIPWFEKEPAKLVKDVLCPDGQSRCPDGSTCCKLTSGQYGCCPLPKAVCCSDHLHCCPNGTTCDVAQGKCNRGKISIPWFEKEPAKVVIVKDVLCPDGQSRCPDGSTCCKLTSGQYGCCPLPKAVCCSDHLHCCPNGTTCDVAQGKCNRGKISIPWFEKEPAKVIVKDVICPDGQSRCPDGSTCCKLTSGQYGCCPLPKAVCCSDHLHCCPNGTTCDVAQGKCNRGKISIPWFEKEPAKVVIVKDVICPDGQSRCPDGSTCCKLTSGQYGCCPLPKAVCCSDHLHCCPKGTTCDVAQGKCNRGEISFPWFKKQPAKPVTVKDVICPDGQSRCPDGSTCCKLTSGQYGCCPLPKAVCCSDHLHCCPSGTTCDVAQGKCNRGKISIPWFEKQAAKPVTVKDVVCPDGQSRCPDGSTCCKLTSGQYGCCPLPKAVCCSDHLHCCPNGTTCDVAQGKCNRGEISFPWFEKQPARVVIVKDVICPDGQSRCPDGSTCCKLTSGQYGCCPLPKAVCCSDHLHCCPNGTTCDVAQGKCNRGEISFPWFEKQPSTPVTVKDVICPDGQSRCPDGSTCCKLTSGQYGCCPLPKAVCCSDHLHCCPNGTTCDVAQGKCNRGKISIPWFEKEPAKVIVKDVICPDGQSRCPDGSTCCKLTSGQYGCCPLPKAVCCSDHLHCCPNGTTCDVAQGKCNRGKISIPWFEKEPAKIVIVKDVLCPDGQSRCPDGSTCCKLTSGQYGCCPLPKAVCCSDHLHCCPNGTTCDVAQGKCNRGKFSISWFEKKPAKLVILKDVICPDGQSRCPDGSTCCKLTSGQYGCCPLPKAVCCSDHLHCCPNGTTCDVAQGKCNRGLISIPWLEKIPAL